MGLAKKVGHLADLTSKVVKKWVRFLIHYFARSSSFGFSHSFKKNPIHLVLILIVFFVLFSYWVRWQKKEGFEDSGASVMLFYADWCPHCKTAKPIWYDLKSSWQGKPVQFVEVDCSAKNDANVEAKMQQYGVKGFPTIKLVQPGGQIIDFNQSPSKDSLTAFLNDNL
jgi:thiol-disulfide isomerase/thioredoxin